MSDPAPGPGDPTEIPPLLYTEIELESYIPPGWRLAAGDPAWNPQRCRVEVGLVDSCALSWTLEISQSEAEELGRIEALRRAVDRLERNRFASFL